MAGVSAKGLASLHHHHHHHQPTLAARRFPAAIKLPGADRHIKEGPALRAQRRAPCPAGKCCKSPATSRPVKPSSKLHSTCRSLHTGTLAGGKGGGGGGGVPAVQVGRGPTMPVCAKVRGQGKRARRDSSSRVMVRRYWELTSVF